jgi:hypothetical protein
MDITPLNITVSTTVETVSDKTLLRAINTEYNPDAGARQVNLVWRRKRGKSGLQHPSNWQRISHWGLEIISPGQKDGYVWELRMDKDGRNVLASASSLNVEHPSWRGDGISKAFTTITTRLKDSDIQYRGM